MYLNANKKSSYVLNIKNMRDKKATEDNGVPGDLFKLFGEDGLRLIKETIKNIDPRISFKLQ
jgi:hypothetical protein